MSYAARPLGRGAWRPAIVLAVAALVALACSPDMASPSPGLIGTSWTVKSINGGNVIANAPPTIEFGSDRKVSGFTGCNQYSALYTTNGARMSVGSMNSTQIPCDGAATEQETAFLNGLGGATGWRINEAAELEIDGAATIVARQGAPGVGPSRTAAAGSPGSATVPAELVETTWNLAEMGGTADFAGLVPTIDFGDDRTVAGFAGCNTFSGAFMTDGASLRLGPLASTKIGCPRPASVVEADYLNALAGTRTWLVDVSGRLILGGQVVLKFTPR